MNPPAHQGENVYAHPAELSSAEGVPEAPHSFGWRVENSQLWVAANSRLPMIDLFSGQSDEIMTMRKIEVRYRPWWSSWLPFAVWLALVIWLVSESFTKPRHTTFPFEWLLPSLLICWLVSQFTGMFNPICTLSYFTRKKTLRIQRIYGCSVFGAPLLVILGGMFSRQTFIHGTTLAVFAIVVVTGFWIRRRLFCRRVSGGWFELRGIHPQSVAFLQRSNRRQSTRFESQGVPPNP